MIKVTPSTKIAAVLKNYPQTLEAIIRISPAFGKLRNPVLRKLLAGRVSIRDAARIGKCSLKDFYNALYPYQFPLEGFSDRAAGTADTLPRFPEASRRAAFVLDVRELLAQGKDPVADILTALGGLQHGQLLALVNSFEPVPLLRILEKKGFTCEVTQQDDDVITYIGSENAAPLDAVSFRGIPSASFEARVLYFSGRIRFLDVSGLQMPGPLMTILGELENLAPQHALCVVHRKVPLMLLPVLQEKGFAFDLHEQEGADVQLLIYRPADMAGREDGGEL